MLKEIFSDHKGMLSSVRVNSFIAIIAAILLSFYSIKMDSSEESLPIIMSWLVAGFGPKVVQKFAEVKNV